MMETKLARKPRPNLLRVNTWLCLSVGLIFLAQAGLSMDVGLDLDLKQSGQCGECSCEESSRWSGTFADCSAKDLITFPLNLPETVDHLDLSNNMISLMDLNNTSLCRALYKLKSVSLAHNGITDLGSIFTGCTNLREIDLSGNKLLKVEASTFQEAGNLESLILEVDYIQQDALGELHQLQTLSLTYHALSIDRGLFDGMTHLKELELVLSKCQSLPEGLLSVPTLTKLSLTGSKVKLMSTSFLSQLDKLNELSVDLPQYPQLTLVLDKQLKNLKSLAIKNVKKLKSLSGLDSLEALHLEGIHGLPGGDLFGSLGSLKALDLMKCSLSKIPPNWFFKLTSLEDLNLSQNELALLNASSFTGLRSLKHLNLSNNKLKSVPGAALAPLQDSLQLLVLRKNYIDSLKTRTFDHLPNLKWLDLSSNVIANLEEGTFNGMSAIIAIHLEHNHLSHLNDDLFYGLPLLEKLDLSGNSFSTIPKAVGQSTVSVLILNENPIDSIGVPAVCSMANIRDLWLRDSPIHCDCSVSEVLDCLADKQALVHGTCSAPESVRGKDIVDFTSCEVPLGQLTPPIPIILSSTPPSMADSNLKILAQDTAGDSGGEGREITRPLVVRKDEYSQLQPSSGFNEREKEKREVKRVDVAVSAADNESESDSQTVGALVDSSVKAEVEKSVPEAENMPDNGTVMTKVSTPDERTDTYPVHAADNTIVKVPVSSPDNNAVTDRVNTADNTIVLATVSSPDNGSVRDTVSLPDNNAVTDQVDDPDNIVITIVSSPDNETVVDRVNVADSVYAADNASVMATASTPDRDIIMDTLSTSDIRTVTETVNTPDNGVVMDQVHVADNGSVMATASTPDSDIIMDTLSTSDIETVTETVNATDNGIKIHIQTGNAVDGLPSADDIEKGSGWLTATARRTTESSPPIPDGSQEEGGQVDKLLPGNSSLQQHSLGEDGRSSDYSSAEGANNANSPGLVELLRLPVIPNEGISQERMPANDSETSISERGGANTATGTGRDGERNTNSGSQVRGAHPDNTPDTDGMKGNTTTKQGDLNSTHDGNVNQTDPGRVVTFQPLAGHSGRAGESKDSKDLQAGKLMNEGGAAEGKVGESWDSARHSIIASAIVIVIVVASISVAAWIFVKGRHTGSYRTRHEALRQDTAQEGIELHDLEIMNQ